MHPTCPTTDGFKSCSQSFLNLLSLIKIQAQCGYWVLPDQPGGSLTVWSPMQHGASHTTALTKDVGTTLLIPPVSADCRAYLMSQPGRKRLSCLIKLCNYLPLPLSSIIRKSEEVSPDAFFGFHPFFMKQKENTQGTCVENCHSVCSSPAPWPGGNTPCKFSPREAVTVVGNTLEQVSRKAWSWGTALTAFPSHILDKEGPLMGVFWNKIFSFLL